MRKHIGVSGAIALPTVVPCLLGFLFGCVPTRSDRAGLQTDVQSGLSVDMDLDLGGGVALKLLLIPAGEFMMGGEDPASVVAGKCHGMDAWEGWFQDEHPQHRVRISRPFYIGICEVTHEQYDAVMGRKPSNFSGPKNPVESVSWDDAQQFCRVLSARQGRTVRLPTEAQWEYACRAGTESAFSFGDTITTDLANYDGEYCYGEVVEGTFRHQTVPVASFRPNAWGLYDMHGNVWEWCQDWYATDYYAKSPGVDPVGPEGGRVRVLRGGSWCYDPSSLRSAYRHKEFPAYRGCGYGFRVVVVTP